MDDADGYFGESVAASYDEESAEMSTPDAVDPAVELLAELAGAAGRWSWASGPGASRCHWRAAACHPTSATFRL